MSRLDVPLDSIRSAFQGVIPSPVATVIEIALKSAFDVVARTEAPLRHCNSRRLAARAGAAQKENRRFAAGLRNGLGRMALEFRVARHIGLGDPFDKHWLLAEMRKIGQTDKSPFRPCAHIDQQSPRIFRQDPPGFDRRYIAGIARIGIRQNLRPGCPFLVARFRHPTPFRPPRRHPLQNRQEPVNRESPRLTRLRFHPASPRWWKRKRSGHKLPDGAVLKTAP